MTAFDTNDVSNDVISTNHTLDTMMTFLVRRNIFCGQGIRETCFFTAGEVNFAAAFMLRGLMTVVSSMGTEDRYVNFRRRLHRFSQ